MGRTIYICFMYDNRKYKMNSFIEHSVVLQYVTVHKEEQIWMPKLLWKQTWRNDVMNMQINMWCHMPPQVSENPVGNTVYIIYIYIYSA